MGVARKGYSATGSLAYLVTAKGAQELVKYFGETVGWTHHTDHAMVEFLDDRNVISFSFCNVVLYVISFLYFVQY